MICRDLLEKFTKVTCSIILEIKDMQWDYEMSKRKVERIAQEIF